MSTAAEFIPKPTHRVYLDNAAATPTDARVVRAMEPYYTEWYANPDALHEEGVRAAEAVERARETVARTLGARTQDVVFTSGGTEANNIALRGVCAHPSRGAGSPGAIVVSAIEHSSVRVCAEALRATGVTVHTVPVGADGRVSPNAVRALLTEHTALVSIMLVNNEIGTIEPINAIARDIRKYRETHGGVLPYLHVDASQAPVWMPVSVDSLGADLVTLDGQKCYGPKGIGCLYHRSTVPRTPIMQGGSQEFGVRPGTPPTPLIVGFAEALQLVHTERASYLPIVWELRNMLAEHLCALPDVVVNGTTRPDACVAGILNVSFLGVDAERLVIELDARGIAVSSRSACLRDTARGSGVVAALGHGAERSESAVRFSLSRFTTHDEISAAVQATRDAVSWLRAHPSR